MGMVVTGYIQVSSKGRRDVIDITAKVQQVIADKGVSDGIVVVFVPGSTAALTTIEFEPGLVKDIDALLERLIPYKEDYRHHQTWHDDNGAAHLQAALMGPSITVPVVNGKLTLGTWQQIVLVDCDTRPRDRTLVVQMIY
ncbi:MAG TPA: secondary thiamine-phosphate synthase enzyme YjbQ [Spirochaetota bacterium]|nr:secondary thiamine-phosphate synthase enzyme YjbQ [Spirochaetota bacterium]